jgi:Hint domain
MATTVSTGVFSQVYLNTTSDNPLTVTNHGSVITSGYAVLGKAGTDWTITNSGSISGTGSHGVGIYLNSSGHITNTSGATIRGVEYAVYLKGGGTVTNTAGSILGSADGLYAGGVATVTNTGTIIGTSGVGVDLSLGGSINNSGSIGGGNDGVVTGYQDNHGTTHGVGTVSNTGTITGTNHYGVFLKDGGTVSNTGASALIKGADGIRFTGGNGTLTNSGSIVGTSGIGVDLASVSGSVTNAAGGSIYGKSDGLGFGGGVTTQSVFVTNAASASISGYNQAGVLFTNENGTLLNSGSIAGTGNNSVTTVTGVYIGGGGQSSITNSSTGSITGTNFGVRILTAGNTVNNSGSISAGGTVGGAASVGIYLKGSNFVTNTSTGSISGRHYGIYVTGAAGTVVNSGSISESLVVGATADAISFKDGGSVTNQASAHISGSTGVYITGASGTVVNYGSILGSNNYGVDLVDGGTVTNKTSALISAVGTGILVGGDPATINNSGTVTGGSIGIKLNGGGSVTNAAGASITGAGSGVEALLTAATLNNSGTITGTASANSNGVLFLAGGSITNAGTGLIKGLEGVSLSGAGTVVNAGTITSTGGTAIAFTGTGSHLLVDDPGAVFNGIVSGSTTSGATNTLELAAGGAGVISGLGTSFTNFGTVNIDSTATWTMSGTNTLASGSTLNNSGTLTLSGTLTDSGGVANNGKIILDPGTMTASSITGTGTITLEDSSKLTVSNAVSSGQTVTFLNDDDTLALGTANAFSGTIDDFAAGDIIDLTAVSATGAHADMNYSTNLLTVTQGGHTYTFQFDPTESFAGDFFHITKDNNGNGPGLDITENTSPCYCPGTLIRTPDGETPVEDLAIGDQVMTKSGTARAIKWIGRRSYAGRFALGRTDVLPVCIKAGALAENTPARDLWISPHHAMYFADETGGVLIEAKDLVNGVSIVQADRVEKVEYFHVELDSHDVLVAEGALSESYVNDDSRGMFNNALDYDALYAELDGPAQYCAPRLDQGYQVDATRLRIAQRAGLALTVEASQIGALRGHLDGIASHGIRGWAQNTSNPETPVCLDIIVDGKCIGQTLANAYREDLARAGLGSGRHSFSFMPSPALLAIAQTVEVRRALDGALLGTIDTSRRLAS